MKQTKDLTLPAMFIALGLVLPFLTGGIPQVGRMLLPMHLPVFLCGLVYGWKRGAIVGFILPLLRSVVFGMPVMFPTAVSMAFELLTYGLVAGFLYKQARCSFNLAVYRAILVAMLAGRLVWALFSVLLLGIGENGFTWQVFVASGFTNAIPGIVVQLTLIPAVMIALKQAGFVTFEGREGAEKDAS